jgi:hypothetical protein
MLTRFSRTAVLGAALVSLAGAQAALAADDSVRPDDRAAPRGPGAIALVAADSADERGFDWGDGAVGAAGGFAIGLAAAGVAVVATRRQRPVAAEGAV